MNQGLCTECTSRSLTYDFRYMPYNYDITPLIDGSGGRPKGRSGALATDISYSDVCLLSGGRVISSEDNRYCTVRTAAPDIPTFVAPDMFRSGTHCGRDALAPGALGDAKTFCRSLSCPTGNRIEYAYPLDFCVTAPFGR
jgi:hypothetical protein